MPILLQISELLVICSVRVYIATTRVYYINSISLTATRYTHCGHYIELGELFICMQCALKKGFKCIATTVFSETTLYCKL